MDRTSTGFTRRAFLKALGAGVSLVAVSAELAEALSPKRTIFLPPQAGWPEINTVVLFKGLPVDNADNALIEMLERRMRDAAACFDRRVWLDWRSRGLPEDTVYFGQSNFAKALPEINHVLIERPGELKFTHLEWNKGDPKVVDGPPEQGTVRPRSQWLDKDGSFELT